LNYVGTYKVCDLPFLSGHEGICPSILADGMINFFPLIPVFILSLITYKMREEVFRAWGTFALVWIPFSMFAILIAPEYGNDFVPIEKGTVAFFSSVLFFIISIAIITWKYVTLRRT
jgi:hypothetical protein